MIKSVEILRRAIENVGNDSESEELLRNVLRRAADRAPIEALIEMCETLITIRERDALRAIECN